jgi:integrase
VSSRSVEDYFAKQAVDFIGSYEGFNPCRVHSLRSAFRTLIRAAGCKHEYVEFWMGHDLGNNDQIYTCKTHNGWREEYQKYEPAVSFAL